MDARKAYESAVAKGHAPAGATASEIAEKGSAIQEAARLLIKADRSLTYDAARNRVRRAANGGSKRVNEDNTPDVYEESKLRRAERNLQNERRKAREALDAIEDMAQLRTLAFGLTPDKVKPPGSWHTITRKPSGKREVPILFTSDFQVGEVITLKETRGENEYNLDIFRRRYRTMIGVAVNLIEKHHDGADQIVYLRGGDTISGGIHDELADTDEVTPPMQCIVAIEEEVAGIRHLADRFGRVHVISVHGNHDRTTHKPRNKASFSHSFETIIQWAIQAHFKDDPRVTFTSDESGDVLFEVCGYRMLLTHGDAIGSGGGAGFLGPSGPIVRGAKKVKYSYAGIGEHIDLVLMGHYHNPVYIRNEVMCNGSTAGHSEYARRRIRVVPQAPIQTLFFVHERHGVTAVREIDVNNRPRKTKAATVVR